MCDSWEGNGVEVQRALCGDGVTAWVTTFLIWQVQATG